MRVNAVIVAAGAGKRMGGGAPKALLLLAGRPLVCRALARFAASSAQKAVVVVPETEQAEFDRVLRAAGDLGTLSWVLQAGGARRQDSVRLGLERLDPDCEIVVVHDAARPLVSPALIDRCVDAAGREGAAAAGLPVKDTIKVVTPDRRVASTPPRDSLWAVQTPQAFRVALIREAHARGEKDGVEATDDAMLVERLGKTVALVEGDPVNLKITTPEDLLLAETLLREGRVV